MHSLLFFGSALWLAPRSIYLAAQNKAWGKFAEIYGAVVKPRQTFGTKSALWFIFLFSCGHVEPESAPPRQISNFLLFVSNRFAEQNIMLFWEKKKKKRNLSLGRLALGCSPSITSDFFFSFLQNAGGDVGAVGEESWHPWSWHSVFWCGVSRTK